MPTISVKYVLWAILCGMCIWVGGYLYFATNMEIDQKSAFQNADGIRIEAALLTMMPSSQSSIFKASFRLLPSPLPAAL